MGDMELLAILLLPFCCCLAQKKKLMLSPYVVRAWVLSQDSVFLSCERMLRSAHT